MSNPFSQSILRVGTEFCEECRKKKIDEALTIFAGDDSGCRSCHLYSFFLAGLLRLGSALFNVDLQNLKNFLKDPVVRRGLASVLSGIGRYGITKPQLLDAPFLVVWNYTNACNLRCKHCYQSAGKPTPDELTTEKKLEVVHEFADAGIVSLAISGGEPLMSRDLLRIIREAYDQGMYVALATNGVLITRSVAKRLKENGLGYVEVSLDSSDPEIHDDFRGVRGSHRRALEGIKHCIEQDIFTCIATTVTKFNIDGIGRLIDLAEEIGVRRFIIFNFIPAGRGEISRHLDLSPEERENLLRMFYEESKRRKIQILSTAPQFSRVTTCSSSGSIVAPTHFYIGKASWDLNVLAEFIGGCGAGRLYCALQPNGDVTPCVFMPQSVVGNIRETPFLDIWRNSPLMQKLRDRSLLKGHCGSCQFKYICGGCRARALGYLGDILGPDPGCIHNKDLYERRELLLA